MMKKHSIVQVGIIIAFVLFISIGGVVLIYLGDYQGLIEMDRTIIIAVMSGGIVGGLVPFLLSKYKQKKKGNIPVYDERTVLLLQKYFNYVLYTLLFGGSLALLVMYGMGVEMIRTELLIVGMTVVFIATGIGSLIIKRL